MNLREIEVESYRRLLGIVEQDVFLFDGTIAENIAYGDRWATRARIEQAARAANAAEFIDRLPDGYNTLIGERGVRLSGGQRQRLAIARAVLADPKIFILDEATSNLDSESERLIQQSLDQLLRGRTSFVIAHRLSTIRHADRILVLDDGDDRPGRQPRRAHGRQRTVPRHGRVAAHRTRRLTLSLNAVRPTVHRGTERAGSSMCDHGETETARRRPPGRLEQVTVVGSGWIQY